jgi:hypothetical protein
MQDKEQLKASTEHERDLWIAANPLNNGVRKERCKVWNVSKNVKNASIIRGKTTYTAIYKIGHEAYETKEAALDFAEKEREKEIKRLLWRLERTEHAQIDVTDYTVKAKP